MTEPSETTDPEDEGRGRLIAAIRLLTHVLDGDVDPENTPAVLRTAGTHLIEAAALLRAA